MAISKVFFPRNLANLGGLFPPGNPLQKIAGPLFFFGRQVANCFFVLAKTLAPTRRENATVTAVGIY
jgi:hypothetical protein